MPTEPEEKKEKKTKEKSPKGNVVLEKFKKDQEKENKNKKWRMVEDAVQAARKAYTGGFEHTDPEVKTISFDKAVKDLKEVLQKILDGEIKMGGLGESEGKIEIAEGPED